MQTYQGRTSATQTVFEVIKDNPGISTQDISEILPTLHPKTIQRTLNHLRENRHEIENRGLGTGHRTFWHVVERSDPFYKLAEQLLDEIKGMPVGMRRAYLAEELESIAKGEKP